MSRQAVSQDLHLRLPGGGGTLAHRIATALIDVVARDEIRDGEAVPSTRSLAAQLSVSRSAVVAAYEELSAYGYLDAKAGAATRVAQGAGAAARQEAGSAESDQQTVEISGVDPGYALTVDRGLRSADRTSIRFDLRPGYPDPTLIDKREWLRAARSGAQSLVSTSAANEMLSEAPPRFRELQLLIADHVRVRRGLMVDPADIFFFPSVDAALHVVGRVLNVANEVVAVENPGYTSARTAFQRSGAAIVDVDVDDDGIVVERLPVRAAAIYVTPAHQFPLGTRLSASRRADLLRWAQASDSYVIEDDYDGEFRYDVVPMKPMRAMAGGDRRVFYLGTSSKALSRDLRISWTIVPPSLRRRVEDATQSEPDSVSRISAAVLTELLRSGYLLRHSAKVLRTYRARRDRFVSAAHAMLPEARILGVNAGLHVVLAWPELDDRALTASLADHGVLVTPLSSYYSSSPTNGAGLRGIVCGYAKLPETQAAHAVGTIADVRNGMRDGAGT